MKVHLSPPAPPPRRVTGGQSPFGLITPEAEDQFLDHKLGDRRQVREAVLGTAPFKGTGRAHTKSGVLLHFYDVTPSVRVTTRDLTETLLMVRHLSGPCIIHIGPPEAFPAVLDGADGPPPDYAVPIEWSVIHAPVEPGGPAADPVRNDRPIEEVQSLQSDVCDLKAGEDLLFEEASLLRDLVETKTERLGGRLSLIEPDLRTLSAVPTRVRALEQSLRRVVDQVEVLTQGQKYSSLLLDCLTVDVADLLAPWPLKVFRQLGRLFGFGVRTGRRHSGRA